jgi:RecB family exonuclease
MGMGIPSDFQFSQASLQDYIDCPRRFFYRYVERLAWPALEAEPALANEQWNQQGTDFHRMVHRYVLGIPPERLTQSASGNLAVWWRSFLENIPFRQGSELYPEKMLAVELNGRRLVAKIDLVVVNQDCTIDIFDWKTSRKVPDPSYVKERLQSKIYPFVLGASRRNFGLDQLLPGNIRMTYWYAARPGEQVSFWYNQAQWGEDEVYLGKLIDEIIDLESSDQFPLTSDEGRCWFCVYRSLCERGEAAGNFEEAALDVDTEFDLDFDLIEEIEY